MFSSLRWPCLEVYFLVWLQNREMCRNFFLAARMAGHPGLVGVEILVLFGSSPVLKARYLWRLQSLDQETGIGLEKRSDPAREVLVGLSVKTKLRRSECLVLSWPGAPQNHRDLAEGLKAEAAVGAEPHSEVAAFVMAGSEVGFY